VGECVGVVLSQGGSVSLLEWLLVLVLVWEMETVVEEQSSVSDDDEDEVLVLVEDDSEVLVLVDDEVLLDEVLVLVLVAEGHPVASTMAQVVAQPSPLHCSWQGNDV
jgi:hypothetical protein